MFGRRLQDGDAQMLDISRGLTAASCSLPPIEFLRIELAPLMGGTVRASVTATTVDDAAEMPELLDQEVVEQPVASVEELIALIRTHVVIGATPLQAA
jgi:hypothetical protein